MRRDCKTLRICITMKPEQRPLSQRVERREKFEDMIRFDSDYLEGAHERILARLAETNREQTVGYGEDAHCAHARQLIAEAVGDPEAYVQFLVGGTQTNLTVLAAILQPYEGVLAAETAHIACHETGAIEATGHKVLTLPEKDGKISAAQVEAAVRAHEADPTHEHTVMPGAVYISFPTELGTIYTKNELFELHEVCRANGLVLFLDGARLGYGLAAEGCDVTLEDIYSLTDVFYIGGTKVGALFGEALVFHPETPHRGFRYMIKQRGGMLAKGRLLGLQFETLFEGGRDCLYRQVSIHADALALKLRDGIRALGFSFACESPTNQQFPILPDSLIEKLAESYGFQIQHRVSETESAIRLCTSWATEETYVDSFLADLAKLKAQA